MHSQARSAFSATRKQEAIQEPTPRPMLETQEYLIKQDIILTPHGKEDATSAVFWEPNTYHHSGKKKSDG